MGNKTIYELRSEYAPRTNFTMIPNIILHKGLSPYAFALYVNICNTVGNGEGMCYKSVQTLVKECNMSNKSVAKAKKELEEKGLIQIGKYRDNNTIKHIIVIKDIWQENSDYFKKHDVNIHRTNT